MLEIFIALGILSFIGGIVCAIVADTDYVANFMAGCIVTAMYVCLISSAIIAIVMICAGIFTLIDTYVL